MRCRRSSLSPEILVHRDTMTRRSRPERASKREARRGRSFSAAAVGLALGGLAGCADASPQCRVGADCASGVCSALGTCVDPSPSGGGAVGGAGAGNAGGSNAEGGSPGAGGGGATTSGGEGGGGLCSPDANGRIDRREVPLEAGLTAKFRVATDAAFDSGGTPDGNGAFTWDLAQAFGSDVTALVETVALSGRWFEDDFAGATYTTALRNDTDLLGVFEITDTALLLRGVVSPDDGVFRTNLNYAPPVVVLSFPFEAGDTWTTDSQVTGLANGVFTTYAERYEATVDKRGTVQTPFGDFPALRVHTNLQRTVGFVVTDVQTHAFVAECFGTVATLSSPDGETGTEFSLAAELRRLAP